MRARVLVISAWEEELGDLRNRPPEEAVELLPVGVGGAAAAAGLARRLALPPRPRVVLLLGTAGAYPGGGVEPGEVVAGGTAVLLDAAVARGEAYLPAAQIREHAADPDWTAQLVVAGARLAVVGCPPGITTDPALAAALAARAAVENLEAFAVLEAAAGGGVPAGICLGISNVVGPLAHEQWRAHAASAVAAASRVLSQALRAPEQDASPCLGGPPEA